MRPAKLFSGLRQDGIRALGTRYDHLTLDERKLIFQVREAKMSVPRIAERLGRHRSTIHREIQRNARLLRPGRPIAHRNQDEWKGFFQPFLKASEVRSHKAFMKDAQRVSVREREADLKITPHRNLGPKEGFEPTSAEIQILPSKDLTVAAEMVLMALKLA